MCRQSAVPPFPLPPSLLTSGLDEIYIEDKFTDRFFRIRVAAARKPGSRHPPALGSPDSL